MKRFYFIYTLSILFTLSVSADSVFTCEAKTVGGDRQTLEPEVFAVTYPTIIINYENDSILFVYNKAGKKWESNYEIIMNDGNQIIGKRIEPIGPISDIYFQIDKKLFSTVYAGAFGNSLTFGNCL